MSAGPDTEDDLDPADAEYYSLVLRQLTDTGVTLLHAITRETDAHTAALLNDEVDPGRNTVPNLAMAYDRVSRAIRRTVALARRLAKIPSPARRARQAARRQVTRQVEQALARLPAPEADPLRAELAERLDDPVFDDDILFRPVPELVADICRDLGLPAPPPRPITGPANPATPPQPRGWHPGGPALSQGAANLLSTAASHGR